MSEDPDHLYRIGDPEPGDEIRIGDRLPPRQPILPPGVAPLSTLSTATHANASLTALKQAVENGTISDADLTSLLQSVPRERMRKLVYEYMGMGASLFTTLTKQVQLVDTVLSQLVSPDGTLKPPPAEGLVISLKDALSLSIKNTQMILRDLPKVYSVERVQRLEMAIGDVMDKFFTPEQQAVVLERLEELTTDKGKAL